MNTEAPNQDAGTETIFGTIRQEINDFINNYIEVVPGFNFSQYQTIKRCHLYVNSRYYDQSLYNGREKIFFNISKYRKDQAVKLIDIDTKDIRLWPSNPKSDWSTFFLEKELKLWLKDNHISKKLNEMADKAATYGTVVVKKTKAGASVVDLRRLFLDPTVKTIKKSRFVTIKHYLTPEELREKVKDGWDKKAIEEIIKKKKGQKSMAPMSYENFGYKNPIVSTPLIEVYERYGEIDAKYFGSPSDIQVINEDPVRALVIVAEPFMLSTSADNKYEWHEGSVLFCGKWMKDWPFNDFHYSQTEGRWLGVGVMEELFPLQERFNELANQKRIAMEISSLHLFQTADATVVDNILTDLQSGDLIRTKTPDAIKPIANEERNLEAFKSEEESYGNLADRVSFINDVISGSNLPSSTPATNAALANTNSTSLFKYKRQNFAIFLREFFDEFVLPQVVKDITPEHILRFTGDTQSLQKLDDAHTTVLVNQAVIDHVLNGGHVPIQSEVDAIKQKVTQQLKKRGGNRFVKFKSDFYGDSEFEFDIVIDEESEPIATLANNTFQLLTAVAQNPTLLQNPVTKELIYQWASKVGINPVTLEMAEASQTSNPQQQTQPTQQGGAPQGQTISSIQQPQPQMAK